MTRNFPFSKIEVFSALATALLFLVFASLSSAYQETIRDFVNMYENWGVAIYIGATIIATVVAPVGDAPLIPIASAAWGPVLAAIYSIIGWLTGAIIAFWISRRYGYEWVSKFVKVQRIQQYVEQIPKRNLFWTVVLFRIIFPVDVLSYALGLFSKMSLRMYILATIIGITPFAFIFAYTAGLPFWLQVLVLSLTGVFILIFYVKIYLDLKKNTGEKK